MNKELMIKKLRGFIYEDFVTAKEYAERKGVSPRAYKRNIKRG